MCFPVNFAIFLRTPFLTEHYIIIYNGTMYRKSRHGYWYRFCTVEYLLKKLLQKAK